MIWRVLGVAAVLAIGAAAPAPAQAPMTMASPAPAATTRPPGYLSATEPDTYAILPPAPVEGTIRYEADRKMFLATRSFKDSPRWAMAAADADQPALLKHLACAVGVQITAANAPVTAAMMGRVMIDASVMTNRPKDIYKRKRPYLIDEGPTCIDKTAALSASPDYPSGHNTAGWAYGLILAELAPDRATPILQRARAFGESRLVCGVHNLSAVEAGRMNASIIVAGLHGIDQFRADMDIARKEVAAARKAGPAPDPAACAREAELVSKSPY
jgi:acid phosphatase (class A)